MTKASLIWHAFFVLSNASYSMQRPARMPGTSPSRSMISLEASQSSSSDISNSRHQVVQESDKNAIPPTDRKVIKTLGKPKANTETLSQLVNNRPPPRKAEALRQFQQLFAKHHRVQQLDRHTDPLDLKALREGWTQIRREEKGYFNSRKMENAITDHLREGKKVPEHVVKGVRFHWRKEIHNTKEKRHRDRLINGATPHLVAKYQEIKLKNKYVQRRLQEKKRSGKKPLPFRDYMTIHGIQKGLPAKDIEEKSRMFRHEYPNSSASATLALKNYLESEKYDPVEIEFALGARSEDFMKARRARTAERKASGPMNSQADAKEQHQVTPKRNELSSGSKSSTILATSQDSFNRKRKIQELLDSNKKWYSTSNL